MLSKIKNFIFKHKKTSTVLLIIIVVGGYFLFKGKSAVPTTYVLAAVEKGTLISSVTGSGQVSASNQVDIKAKTSGEVTVVSVKVGQEVKAGAFLAQIDASDALKALRDAQTALETAKLELEEVLKPADELTLLQAENSLIQAQQSQTTAEDNLAKAYEDGFNNVANAFLDLPTVMTGLNDILFSHTFSSSQANLDYYAGAIKTYNDDNGTAYRDDAYNQYQAARTAYDKNFTDYKNASRFSSSTVIENLIVETYETTKNIAEAVKSVNNLIRLYQDKLIERNLKPQTTSDTHLTSLSSYTSKTNSYLTSLLSAKDSIHDDQESITNAERSIKEKELSLAKTKAGSDELTIRAKKIAVQQKQDALASAQQDLYDCSARAPFAGVVAAVSVKRGDTISSGTAIATVITKQKIAEISLNEVDMAKIKVGQKVTLTFDAVSDLTITGEVAEVDSLGTVSQGVVTYTTQIIFDTQDERIKSGMSVSAAIITDMKQDVLIVPSSAIKYSVSGSYIEMPDEQVMANNTGVTLKNTPRQQTVETGITNDTSTEITSGLNVGDIIIVRTVTSGATSQSNGNSTNRSGNTGFMIPH